MYLSLKIDINYHIKERCTITIIYLSRSSHNTALYMSSGTKFKFLLMMWRTRVFSGGKRIVLHVGLEKHKFRFVFRRIWKLRKHNVHKFRFVFVSARQGHKIPRSQLLCKWVLLIFQVEWTRVQMILKG